MRNKIANYQSEFTIFLNDQKKKFPLIEIHQAQGRALLWDKYPIDLDTAERIQNAQLSQPSYVYQSK